MIMITSVGDKTYEVTVEAQFSSTHRVTLEPGYYEKLTGGRVHEETLVHNSFEFLLEHEPNASILRRFDLSVIARYFPDYEKKIQARLGGR